MINQKEAAVLLLALSVTVYTRLIAETENQETVSNYEMNEEQDRLNFFALWDTLTIAEKDILTTKLQQVK